MTRRIRQERRRGRVLARLLSVVLVHSAASGCVSRSELWADANVHSPGPCTTDSECAPGYVCSEGQCVGDASTACEQNSDCPETCIAGSCTSRSSEGGPCDEDEDCSGLVVCVAMICERWQDLGGSDFGPRHVPVTQGSMAGGGISASAGFSHDPSITLDAQGVPVVAWEDATSGDYEIYVARVDGVGPGSVGTSSMSGGGISNNDGFSRQPAIAADATGNLFVAWQDDSSGNGEIYVARFDGSAWGPVGSSSASAGGVSNNSGDSGDPCLMLDSAANPVVAWVDDTSGASEIYVARFDGAVWQPVGPSGASGGGISNTGIWSAEPAIVVDAAGNPIVAWENFASPAAQVYVARFDGTAWQPVGPSGASGTGVSNSPMPAASPSIALDGSGAPVLAWSNSVTLTHSEIYVARFDGAVWQPVGALGASGTGVSNTSGISGTPQLAVAGSGGLTVAWTDLSSGNAEIYVAGFDGSAWLPVGVSSSAGGGISANAGPSVAPSLVLDEAGDPIVAWEDHSSGNREIYLGRFNGSAWQAVFVPNAAGNGVSEPTRAGNAPSLAMDGSAYPVVAWVDFDADNREIFVSRYDGSSWVSVGTGSTSGGGISDTPEYSTEPVAIVDPAGNPIVAWKDGSSGRDEIYVKRFDGVSWEPVGASGASGGGVSNAASWTRAPALALDGIGAPVLAWEDGSSGRGQVYVARLDGDTWQPSGPATSGGGASNSSGWAGAPSIAIGPNDDPVIAWDDTGGGGSQIYVARFSAGTWQPVGVGAASGGGVSNTGDSSHSPALALDVAGNPSVAWTEYATVMAEVWVAIFDGTSWQTTTAHGAMAQGPSRAPRIAIGPSDYPIVVWNDESSGQLEVFASRFDGSAWLPLGSASASGGGVSNSSAASDDPSASVRNNRVCIAWSEGGAYGRQILARCAGL